MPKGYYELTGDPGIPGAKVGQIMLLEEGVGRGFIAANLAKESDVASYTQATTRSELDAFKAEMRGLIQQAATPVQGQNLQPPGQGVQYTADGVVTSHVRGGEASSERGKKCFADILRCIYWAQGRDIERGLRQMGDERLNKVYGFARTEFDMDKEGRVFSIERTADGGVYRTGGESIGGGPTYGFLVKPEWYGTLYRIMVERSILADDAFQVPIGQALELKWPALDQFGVPTAGQSSAYAGVTVTRAGEIQQRIYSDGKVYEIDFKVTDLTGFTTLSRDLIADNYIAADAMIQELFGIAFAWKFDQECLFGPSNGAPQGVLTAANGALIVGGPATNKRSLSGHIRYEDLSWMLSKLHPSCWRDSFWVTNVTTTPDLQAIQNAANAYVYQPNSLLSQAMIPSVRDKLEMDGFKFSAGGTLMGLPLKFSEKVPVLGATSDITLIHPKSYGIAQRAGLEVGLSEHFLFDTDRIAYRFKMRNDARSLWRAPYTQADGSNTQVAPFISLATF